MGGAAAEPSVQHFGHVVTLGRLRTNPAARLALLYQYYYQCIGCKRCDGKRCGPDHCGLSLLLERWGASSGCVPTRAAGASAASAMLVTLRLQRAAARLASSASPSS
jgi:hypothetical protein